MKNLGRKYERKKKQEKDAHLHWGIGFAGVV